jgi:hypothetical protein
MLYLCALDAQNEGKKELGFSVLKNILRDYDESWMTDEAKDEIRLPVIFRYFFPSIGADIWCVIRFTFGETDQGRTADPTVITVLCSQFDAGKFTVYDFNI